MDLDKALFQGKCAAHGLCAATSMSKCPNAITEHGGRFYVTFGHPAFNSPANNGFGYESEAAARAAIRRSAKVRK